jgi:intein-encoded DNA endonuclease-like protein
VKSSGRYVVEAESKTLYELLRKPVDLYRLRRYIEHCERWVAAFLRGFADSEGCVDKRGYIFILNTNLRLLTYIHGSS